MNRNITKAFKYLSILSIPYGWYKLSQMKKSYVKKKMYIKGYNLSQRFKMYSFWDKYLEPFLIRQSAILFIACHSFLEGMTSDNENKDDVKESFEQFKKDVEDELD